MASNLLARYKQKIEHLQLEPSSGGCFEVTIDGDLAYSKLQTGEFPNEDEIVNLVGKRV
ncbi:MAG: SelT/SelW/SelH family protein [Pirellulaceae bacterium]|nr:SelT/SelW/SelH family protein [Pirellulaceae bacterium]